MQVSSTPKTTIAAGVADLVANTKLHIDVKLDPDFDVSITGAFGPKNGYATLDSAMTAAKQYNYSTDHDLGTAVAKLADRFVTLHTDDELRRPWGHYMDGTPKMYLPYYAFRTADTRIVGAIDFSGEALAQEPWRS
jgi:hypothetical protein